MSKKLYFLISFVLVLVLAGNVLGYTLVIWDNDFGNGDRLWRTASNWDMTGPDRVPSIESSPPDWVCIDTWGDPCNNPIINADTNASCEYVDLAGEKPPVGEAVLTMTGGRLTAGTWVDMGCYFAGIHRIDMSGGTITTPVFWWGYVADSYCTLNMSGGDVNITDAIYLGCWVDVAGGGYADINMTGGNIDVNNWLSIGSFDTNDGDGHVDLHGGTIETGLLSMGGGGEGTMDFANDGMMIIDGDYRLPNDWLFDPCSDIPTSDNPPLYTGTIAILAKLGIITAYGTKVGEIITDVNYLDKVGMRAVINLEYGITNPDQTTITAGAVDPNLAWDPDPLFGGGGLLPTDINLLSWAAGENAASHDVYFGTSFDAVNDANIDVNLGVYEGNQPLSDVNYPVSITWDTAYFWRIDEVNDPTTWKGTVWNFVTIPAWATNPSPDVNATGVSPISVILRWDPGPEANDVKGHHVYFSSDFNDVNDRDPSVLTVRDTNTYPAGDLELNTRYYWAVDEVNINEEPNIWPSPNWYFTTADHLIVEDFDLYVNRAELQTDWRDYWTKTDTGCELFLETDLARDGNSMKYTYNNYDAYKGKYGSETEADIANLQSESGLDWTYGGIKALVLYFYGDPCNSAGANDQMYVALSDGTNEGLVKYDPCHGYDMNDIQEKLWHEWNISLKDPCFIAGAVDMNNVAKIYIGFGGARVLGANLQGGLGTVYFDEIRLYPPRCRSELVVADINGGCIRGDCVKYGTAGDCITDYNDVNTMARDWLMYDYNVPAVEISGDPVGWWKLDEGSGTTAEDSAGDNDGTIFNEKWVAGYPNDPCDPNHALHFDADGIAYYDHVMIAERTGGSGGSYPAEFMPATFTVACWVKVDSFEYYDTFVCDGVDQGITGGYSTGFYLYADNPDSNSILSNPIPADIGTFGLGIRTENQMYWLATPAIYKTDTWYHLAATYNDTNTANIYDGKLVLTDANTANIYVDGKMVVSEDVGGPIRWDEPDPNNYYNTFAIGALPDRISALDWYYADGTIDDVRVYGYAMPYGEIVTLAEQGPVLYHDLISPANIYDLEEKLSKIVNFRDYVILADHWLEGPILWPPQ